MSKSVPQVRDTGASNFQIINEALNQLGGPQKVNHSSRFICCPFHGDTDPSLSVHMQIEHGPPLGYYYCFGCGTKGRWNVLADKLNLPQIQEWKSKLTDVADYQINFNDLDDQFLGGRSMSLDGLLKQMGCLEGQPWPENLEWRGYSGKFVNSLGGLIVNDMYNDSIAVLFPIEVHGKIIGGVKAIYERKRKNQLAYVAMAGDWVKTKGWFGYAQALKLIRKYHFKFVVIVEGPRDCMRLLQAKIPCVAMLGASALTERKARMLLNLGVEHVIGLPDNDHGGDTMWANVKTHAKDLGVHLRKVALPRDYDEEGKLIKVDPGNMSEQMFEDFKYFLRYNYLGIDLKRKVKSVKQLEDYSETNNRGKKRKG